MTDTASTEKLRSAPVKGDRVFFVSHGLLVSGIVDGAEACRYCILGEDGRTHYRPLSSLGRGGHTHCHAGEGGCAKCDEEATEDEDEEPVTGNMVWRVVRSDDDRVEFAHVNNLGGHRVYVTQKKLTKIGWSLDRLPVGTEIDLTGTRNSIASDAIIEHLRRTAPPAKSTALRPGDRVRVTESCHPMFNEIVEVVSVSGDGLVADVRNPDGWTSAPKVEWLEPVIDNAICPRCGSGAYQGLFSLTCQRAGGCRTAEERVGEPIVSTDRASTRHDWDIHNFAKRIRGNEEVWTVRTLPSDSYATKELAIAAWKAVRLAEEQSR